MQRGHAVRVRAFVGEEQGQAGLSRARVRREGGKEGEGKKREGEKREKGEKKRKRNGEKEKKKWEKGKRKREKGGERVPAAIAAPVGHARRRSRVRGWARRAGRGRTEGCDCGIQMSGSGPSKDREIGRENGSSSTTKNF